MGHKKKKGWTKNGMEGVIQNMTFLAYIMNEIHERNSLFNCPNNIKT